MMTTATTLSLRARRVPLRAFRHLRARQIRAPFLTAILLLGTLLPHPAYAATVPMSTPATPPISIASVEPADAPAPSIDGIASWYGNPRRYGEPAIAWYTRTSPYGGPVEFYAAAGPALRRFLGDENPYHEHYPVTITNPATGISIEAVVVDWCGCSAGREREKLIDLAPAAFEALGVSLGRGVQKVVVQLGHGHRFESLPQIPDRPAPEIADELLPMPLSPARSPF